MKNPEDPKLNINVRLLRKIQKRILADASSFNMMSWVEWAHGGPTEPPTDDHPCFTEACMAGWAVFLDRGTLKRLKRESLPERARKALGLTVPQASRLFLPFSSSYFYKWPKADAGWPIEFQSKLVRYPFGRAERVANAELAAERIDHFIATKGAE